MEEENKEKLPKITPKYTEKDLAELAKVDHYTAFGKMPVSTKSTEPKYGFGKATRKNMEKVYQSKAIEKGFLGRLL